MQIIYTNTAANIQIQISRTKLYGFKYSYLIQIIDFFEQSLMVSRN